MYEKSHLLGPVRQNLGKKVVFPLVGKALEVAIAYMKFVKGLFGSEYTVSFIQSSKLWAPRSEEPFVGVLKVTFKLFNFYPIFVV